MTIYTVGFTKKTAETFFELLSKHKIKQLVDVRLNNKSQLAGFAKSKDLKYFLKKIANIGYVHLPQLAPTVELLKGYQNKSISWEKYEKRYIKILDERGILEDLDYSALDGSVFLCSEPKAERCHRRLLANYIASYKQDVKIIHL